MKKYEKYKPSNLDWIGDIPEHWKISKVKYNFSFRTGFTPPSGKSEYYNGGNYVWINIGDLDGKYISDSSNKITDKAIEDLNPTIVPKGSLLYSFKLSVGKVAFTEIDCYTNEAIFSIDPDNEDNLEFFYYALPQQIIKNANENIYGAKILNQELIKNADLIIPPPNEQSLIANYLNKKTQEIDQLIEDKKQLLQLFEEEKTAIISQAITKGLNPKAKFKNSGIEWIGEIPKHWKIIKLKHIVIDKLKYGANESAEEEILENPRYIRITDFGKNGKLKKDTFKSLPIEKANDYLLNEGDILFARSGATVGKTFQFKDYNGIACFAGYLIKATPNLNIVLSDYLYLFTKTSSYEQWKNSIFNQATIQNIGADKYSILEITIPPIEEQKEIVNFIQKETKIIDSKIKKTKKLIDLLTEYRSALISDVVTGKVNVIE